MKKTKVIWLHPHFNNWMGGHEYIFQVSKILSKKFDLKIITSTATPNAIKKFKDIGIKLETLNTTSTYNPLYWFFLPYYLNKEIKILKQKLVGAGTADRRDPPDILISSYFPTGIWAEKLKIKHLQICYEPLAFFYDEGVLKGFTIPQRIAFKILKILYKKIDKETILKSDKLFTLSETNKNWIKKVYGRSDAIITGVGVDSNYFKHINRKGGPMCPPGSNNKIVLHSTDYSKLKGTDLVIEALKIICEKVPNIKLYITESLENPREKSRLIKKAEKLGVMEKIEFLGRVKHHELPNIYSNADLFIQPLINRSTSLSVLEAMSCQTPALYKQNFVKEAIKILTNKTYAKKISQKSRKIVEKNYSWEKVAKIIIKYL